MSFQKEAPLSIMGFTPRQMDIGVAVSVQNLLLGSAQPWFFLLFFSLVSKKALMFLSSKVGWIQAGKKTVLSLYGQPVVPVRETGIDCNNYMPFYSQVNLAWENPL